MKRKEAFKRKNNFSFYGRAQINEWEMDYTKEQLNYLLIHNYLTDSAPMEHLGENPRNKYYKFTKIGRKWHNWYSCSLWQYIKYYVIKIHWWKSKWYKLRIACGHHYDWQEYDNLSLDEI